MLVPTRILVPSDFSECSGRALGQALDIANEYQAKVFLLHVVHEVMDLTGLDFINSEKMIQDFKGNALVWAKRSLQKQLDSFPQVNEVEIETIVRQGVPYIEILKVGEEERIDLIVIASLGKSGFAKYLIGSVARNVLKGSKCPVLLTK
ncbi:MAG: universal stress protein family [Nitrospirae bacterium]|nr:universal stress protein family [Nitrospirota bacterium]